MFAQASHGVVWHSPIERRGLRAVWSVILMSASGILLVASVVAALAYPPSRSLSWYLIGMFAKSEVTMIVLGTVTTLILSAGTFLAAALVYFGYPVMGAIICFVSAVASIVTGGGLIAGFVLGIIGSLLAILMR
jgi:hypothetical protein